MDSFQYNYVINILWNKIFALLQEVAKTKLLRDYWSDCKNVETKHIVKLGSKISGFHGSWILMWVLFLGDGTV